MNYPILRLSYGQNYFYIEYFENETIKDIKNLLSRKHNFTDDETFEIYSGKMKLSPNKKIIDIENKNNLIVQGNVNPPRSNGNDNDESEPEIDYLSRFRAMGFKESDEEIMRLLEKYDNRIEEVIAQILIARRKAAKSKS